MQRSLTLFLLAFFFAPLAQGQVVFSSNFEGVGSIIHEKFFTDSSITSGGWTIQDVNGPQSWNIGNFTGSNPYAELNGYDTSSNTSVANEDWLISPSFDATQDLYLEFRNAKNFSGPDLDLRVSTDYDGTSAPSTANWDTLTYNKSGGNYDWVGSGTIDLTGYSDPDIYIAFVYESTSSSSSHWEVDDIRLRRNASMDWLGSKTSIEADSLESITSGVQYGNYGVRMINREQSHKRLTTKPMTLDSGQSYEVTYWVRGDGSARSGLFDGHSSDGDFGFTYWTPWRNISSGSNWQMKVDTLTADTTNANGEFILSVSYTNPSAHMEFDSVVVKEVSTGTFIAERNDDDKELSVYPNPSSERLQVRTKGYGMDLQVTLLDPSGRVVKNRSNNASTRFRFDVQDLESGVYFLRLKSEKGAEGRKVLIR